MTKFILHSRFVSTADEQNESKAECKKPYEPLPTSEFRVQQYTVDIIQNPKLCAKINTNTDTGSEVACD